MSLHILAILGILASGIAAEVLAVTTTQSLYGQCGGIGYTGPTQCVRPAYCYNDGTNPWYSQCVTSPWAAPTTSKSTTSAPIVTTTITILPPPTRTTKPTAGITTTVTLLPDDPITDDRVKQDLASPTGAPEAAADADADVPSNARRQSGPGATLQAGWYWIRAVAQPNYHKYLQTKPATAFVGTAVLESYRTAGQFKIQDGQLVANTGGAAMYLSVEKPADFTQRKLATWFNATRNEFGAFAWQGDALTWSAPEVKRQNLAAWLVCAGQALFINTGAYAYQTPAGCSDQTIHYYNDAHANE